MQRFGRFEIRDLLGEGGFGRVFRAYDPGLKREVAIKTCRLPDPRVRRRFLREAEIAAGLRHPHIVVVHELGEEGGEPFLVQEFLSGEDLENLIERKAPVAIDTRVRWLRDIADALAFAHEHGVVHRDVKPQNIRVLSDGGIRVLDFGIAKRSVDRASTALTQTGFSMGTLGYIAPEQLVGSAIDHRADIFSFGALAFRLLTYAEAFEGDTPATVFYRIANVHPVWPPLVARACAPRLLACIDRCLAKRPDERPQSCRDVVAALDSVLALPDDTSGDAGVAPTPGEEPRHEQPPRHTRMASGRRRIVHAAAAAIVVTAIGGVVHATRVKPPAAGNVAGATAADAPQVEVSDASASDSMGANTRPDTSAARPATRPAAAQTLPDAPIRSGTVLLAVNVDAGAAGAGVAGGATSAALTMLDERLTAAGIDVANAAADASSDRSIVVSARRLGRQVAVICRIAVTDVAESNEFGMASATVTVSVVALSTAGSAEVARATNVATGAGTSVGAAAVAGVRRALHDVGDAVAREVSALPARAP